MSIASEITRIAGLRDTIRTKLIDFGIITNTSAKLTDCATAIEGIDEATLTVPSLSIASNPTIDNSTGLVSVSGNANGTVSASEGYSKGLNKSISVPVSGSLQLATQAAQTITPGTSNKTIAANQWLTGAQTIKGDSNLVATNIKSGTSIFGVSGSAGGSAKIVNGGSVTSSTATMAFNTNLTGTSTTKLYYCTVAVGGKLPIGILLLNSTYYKHHAILIATVVSNNVTYLVFRWGNGSYYGIVYIPYAGETSIQVPCKQSGWGYVYYSISGT